MKEYGDEFMENSRKIRKRARRKLIKLCKKQNNLCHWCKQECVVLRTVSEIISYRKGRITFEQEGQIISRLIASVDHLVDIKDNKDDSNNPENLVMACAKCNVARNNRKQNNKVKVCCICKVTKVRKRKKCLPCSKKQKIEFLKSQGWEMIEKNTFKKGNEIRDFKYAIKMAGKSYEKQKKLGITS